MYSIFAANEKERKRLHFVCNRSVFKIACDEKDRRDEYTDRVDDTTSNGCTTNIRFSVS